MFLSRPIARSVHSSGNITLHSAIPLYKSFNIACTSSSHNLLSSLRNSLSGLNQARFNSSWGAKTIYKITGFHSDLVTGAVDSPGLWLASGFGLAGVTLDVFSSSPFWASGISLGVAAVLAAKGSMGLICSCVGLRLTCDNSFSVSTNNFWRSGTATHRFTWKQVKHFWRFGQNVFMEIDGGVRGTQPFSKFVFFPCHDGKEADMMVQEISNSIRDLAIQEAQKEFAETQAAKQNSE